MKPYNDYKIKVLNPDTGIWISHARHLSYNEAQAHADILRIVGYEVKMYPTGRIPG